MTAQQVIILLTLLAVAAVPMADAFLPATRTSSSPTNTATHTSTIILHASLASRQYTKGGRGGGRDDRGGRNSERSKRQERVGQLVQTELGRILHTGIIRGDAEYLEDALRQRISVVSADLSPDLKQARISVSIRGPNKPQQGNSINLGDDDDEDEEFDEDNEEEFDEEKLEFNLDDEEDDEFEEDEYDYDDQVVDKRRAYAWLVRNTKPIRHTLAQRMSHMKSCPNLSFVQVDVAAATDVMYLIDKVSAGYKRERIGGYNENDMPTGIVSGIDFDEDFDDDEEWDEEEDSKFFSN